MEEDNRRLTRKVMPIGEKANAGLAHVGWKTRATNTPVEGSHVHHLRTRSHDIGYRPLRGNRLPMKGLSLPRQRPWIRRRTPDPLAVKG